MVEQFRFRPSIFEFLEQLAANNNRPWFQANKNRYEEEVFAPAMAFVRAFQAPLKKISPYFTASDKRVGGSLMRVYRDTRFVKNGAPFKTNVGIQFRHELGRDVHAPGFYVHLSPSECFLAAGLWRPEAGPLAQIREAIDAWPDRWKRVKSDRKFKSHFTLEGDCLKRPPRGYEAGHPLIEDIKRTDFIVVESLEECDVLATGFLKYVSTAFTASRPFMRFLCDAVKVPF